MRMLSGTNWSSVPPDLALILEYFTEREDGLLSGIGTYSKLLSGKIGPKAPPVPRSIPTLSKRICIVVFYSSYVSLLLLPLPLSHYPCNMGNHVFQYYIYVTIQ